MGAAAVPQTRGSFGPGGLLSLIRKGSNWTKAELVKQSSLGRTAVADRIATLAAAGYVVIDADPMPTGGRPAETYSFNAGAGRLLVADIGGTHTRLGITDLAGRVWHTQEAELTAQDGPDFVIGYVVDHLYELAGRTGSIDSIKGIGVGVPGPVVDGVMQRPYLPGWEGADIGRYFHERFPGLPVLVDKDANIMARGVQSQDPPAYRNAIVLKVGMGVSCAVIVDGHVLQGAQGASGDIGHLPRGGTIACRCGQYGCPDATASGRAIADKLEQGGRIVRTSREIVELVRLNDPEVNELVRQAGRDLGGPLGLLSATVNPSVIVIGGNLAESPRPLLAGIRETISSDFPPVLTSGIEIQPSAIGAEAGLAGAAQLALSTVLAPHNIDAQLSQEKQ